MEAATRHIVLTGPMGSGKTTVGSILAQRLERPLVDSDAQIEARHGSTGRELAQRHGVSWLHEAEAEALRQAVAENQPSVIAAAASIGDLEDVGALLSDDEVVVVLLVGDAAVLAERAESGAHRREIDVERSQLLAERRNHNLVSVVDAVIDVTTKTPEEIGDSILDITTPEYRG